MKSLRCIAILLAVSLWAAYQSGDLYAQAVQRDTLERTVYFRPGNETVYYSYRTNQHTLAEIRSLLWRNPSAQVFVSVYSALEGDIFLRGELAQKRAHILQHWLESSCGLPASHLEVKVKPDWRMSEEPWARIRIVTTNVAELPVQEFATELSSPEIPGFSRETMVAPKTVLAVKTNLLTIPLLNVMAEVPLGTGWSLGLEWYYPWLSRSRAAEGVDYDGKCFQVLLGGLDVRRWFGARRDRLMGHAVGLFGMGGIYDLEWNYHGYQGEFLAAGVEYAYVCPIFRNKLRLEFSLGLGYLYSRAREYHVYLEGGQAFSEKDMAKDIHYVGPVKGGISLVVPIRTPKRGGRL